MADASTQSLQALWASSLQEIKTRMRCLFTQQRVADSASLFLDCLLGTVQRKTAWMRAETAGDPGPWRQQAILGRGRWDAEALRDIVRDYVLESLADDEAVLVIDETSFLKQGRSSCGVARQDSGSGGKITNCQIGVFTAYASRHGHAFIDRALYLPKTWTDDPGRMAAANVPTSVGFSSKPELAREMIQRTITNHTPFAWVATDRIYGEDSLEAALRRAGKGYVLGVKGTQAINAWIDRLPICGTAEEVAQALPPSAWSQCSEGEASKGAHLHEWAYLELTDQDASDDAPSGVRLWTCGLLIRRRLVAGELAFFSTWAPTGTTTEKLAWVEAHRRPIEDAFETAKHELGLDHNETRSWHGWHRHVSLVMLAFAFLATMHHHASILHPKKTERSPPGTIRS